MEHSKVLPIVEFFCFHTIFERSLTKVKNQRLFSQKTEFDTMETSRHTTKKFTSKDNYPMII